MQLINGGFLTAGVHHFHLGWKVLDSKVNYESDSGSNYGRP